MEEKTKDNRILVLEENGRILSMLHRNPYEVYAGDRLWKCDYIVGVATAEAGRRRGYMRRLMERALADMRAEGMPFLSHARGKEIIFLLVLLLFFDLILNGNCRQCGFRTAHWQCGRSPVVHQRNLWRAQADGWNGGLERGMKFHQT